MLTYTTRIFENVADENLSAFRELTLNQGFYGHEEVQNDVKESRKFTNALSKK